METNNKRKNRDFWVKKVEEAKTFQGTQREFCQNYNLHPSHFSGWKSRLKKETKATKENPEVKKAFVTAILARQPADNQGVSFKKSKGLIDPEWVAEFVVNLWRMS